MNESRLFQVKILDAKGRVKEIISAKKLSILHWERFRKMTRVLGKGNPGFLYNAQKSSPGAHEKGND